MRNFKKFLALVLAMLMVSACAVSVSAFADQEAIDATGFTKAVEMLNTLKVIIGNENQEFLPNANLTRAQAAKIAALLDYGAGHEKIEWKSSTTPFTDVKADHWATAYINYAFQNGIMDGVSTTEKIFDADAELTIAQAIAIAVKAAGLKTEVAQLDKDFGTPAYWAQHWIAVADAHHLTDGFKVFNYDVACTRAMFAQIAYNVIENVEDIANGFGIEKEYATVTKVKDGKVTLTPVDSADGAIPAIKEDAFNAALKDAGYNKEVANLVNYQVTMLWSSASYTIYEVDVLTTADTYTYETAGLKYVPNPDDANAILDKKIELNGKVYDINAKDTAAAEKPTEIGGTVAADTNNIMITIGGTNVTTVVKNVTIPTYFRTVCYDDNGDGDYERAAVVPYELVTLTKGGEIDHDNDANTAKVNATVVTVYGNKDTAAAAHPLSGKYLTVNGAAYTDWSEAPVLVALNDTGSKNTVTAKILETAKTVTGVVSNYKANNYITIGDSKIAFAAGYTAPETWTLSQNVTVYTIGGKFVAVASADTGVESGKVEKQILVDNVTVADGAALIDGYVWNANGTFTKVEDIKVVGVVDGGKLISKTAYELKNVVAINGADKTFAGKVGFGELNDAGTEWKPGKEIVTFEDGYVYKFYVTSAGYYCDKAVAGVDIEGFTALGAIATAPAVEIKGQFIYVNSAAQYKLEDAYSVLAKVGADSTKEDYNNAYNKESYALSTTLKADHVLATYIDKNKAAGVGAGQVDTKVALIYVTASENNAKDVLYKNLNEGEIIVQLVSEENVTLTESTFNAINIFTGEKLTVTGNDAVGNYAVVKDGKIVDDATIWVEKNLTLNVAFSVEGRTISGYNRMIHCDTKGEKPAMDNDNLKDDGSAKDPITYGVDKITYWAFKDGAIDKAGDLSKVFEGKSAIGSTGVLSFTGCIINGQVIILDTPTYTVNP